MIVTMIIDVFPLFSIFLLLFFFVSVSGSGVLEYYYYYCKVRFGNARQARISGARISGSSNLGRMDFECLRKPQLLLTFVLCLYTPSF